MSHEADTLNEVPKDFLSFPLSTSLVVVAMYREKGARIA